MRVADGTAYPEGPITLDQAVAVRLAGEAAIAKGCAVVDLRGVTQVDSSALSVLLAWRRCARGVRTELELRNLPSSIQSLIDLYGVNELVAP
jgi:phospholipid transport system transporter-binding protein